MAEPTPEQAVGNGPKAAAISNQVVRILADYTGRGPTRARTHISGDLVAVVLHDTMTKGERSLVREDLTELVLTTRKAYQNAMRDELVAAVEGVTGRVVIAFMSDNHIEPDMAIEAFVLEPVGGGEHDNGGG